jgi:hypothetical protein
MYALAQPEARKFSGKEEQASQPCLDIAFESTNIRLRSFDNGLGEGEIGG